MAKTYFIPHNYHNNGRVFNMFHKKDLIRAIIWWLPVTILVFSLPLSFNTKLVLEIILAFPPALAILAGYSNLIYYMVRFSKNRRIYYKTRRGDKHVFYYQKAKKERPTSSGNNG